MLTCEHKLAMSGQTDSQLDASSTQVAKPFQCSLARAPVQRKTILKKPTCVHLRWVAKLSKTCVRLRENLSSIKVDASRHKPSQVRASRGLKDSQVTTSFLLAITCGSVWPGLNTAHFTQQTTYMYLKASLRVMARITNQQIAKEDDKGEKDTEEYMFRSETTPCCSFESVGFIH